MTTGSSGSGLLLLDGNSGSTRWESSPDSCQGCRYDGIAFGDVEADGAPEILSARLAVMPFRTVIELRDAVTDAVRWERTIALYTGARGVSIAGSGGREVVLLTSDSTNGVRLHRLDPDTGATVAVTALPPSVTSVHYMPYGGDRGGWLLLGDSRMVWLLDGDFVRPPDRLDIDEIARASSTEFGVAFLASRHSVHRISVTGELLHVDGFEPTANATRMESPLEMTGIY